MKFKAKYEIGHQVGVHFRGSGLLSNCIVTGVSFTESKVMYTLQVPIRGEGIEWYYTTLENIDSVFIVDNEL